MTSAKSPTEIAREALLSLASRRIPPTPENYRTTYNQIAGSQTEASPHLNGFPERELKTLVAQFPSDTPDQLRFTREILDAIQKNDWESFRHKLSERIISLTELQLTPWHEVLRTLLRLWEIGGNHPDDVQKREALEHIFSTTTQNSTLLFQRLKNLTHAWTTIQASRPPISPAPLPPANSSPAKPSDLLPEFRELFAFTLERCVATVVHEHPALSKETSDLASLIRRSVSLKELQEVAAKLKRFAFKLELYTEDQTELHHSLLKVLHLIVDNVNELVVDDQWLRGQMAMVKEVIATPLSQKSLDDAQRRLKEIIFKQGQLKHSLDEARDSLKNMLVGFMDHLADFSGTTSEYHDKIEGFAEKISTASNINELDQVLVEVLRETRSIQLSTLRSHEELQEAQTKAKAAEERIRLLEKELEASSQLIRSDQLTGTLNRRGLEEVFDKEIARAQRHQTPICVALLDIDNFKRLNDALGHDAGDAALTHIAKVIRQTLRPQDTIARYGGEEFVILFPETTLDQATTAMTRLQRELTRSIFLHGNQKLLITFSAGVTQMRGGDSQIEVIKRADDVMYQAKQAGKNKVLATL